MAEVPVHKVAARFVDAWEAAVRERLAETPPDRRDRRVLLGPYFSPEKHADGVLGVGFDDADRLEKLGRSTGWRRSRGWPAGEEISEVQQLGVGLTCELSAGVGRGADRELRDRQDRAQNRLSVDMNRPGSQLADAIGTAVARFHYGHVVSQLVGQGTISQDVERALRSGNGWAQRMPNERLVEAFADNLDPLERRTPGEGRLLDRVHASDGLDKARVAAEILVNRSPVLQQADAAVRTAAADRLTSVIGDQLTTAMKELDDSRESLPARLDRADVLGRRIGEDTHRAITRLEREAAPAETTPANEATRTAETAAATRLASAGVAGAAGVTGPTAPGGAGAGSAVAADSSRQAADRITGADRGNTLG
ncbi:hypothetical protein [Kribbella jiaozuonensis]|uniref:Uncharacterized protein n=1 Tax=Kribbella jiaozuonensis TaxID=2575441 RepID=A0A4U3LD71_9ACTN|nr:hypothetical protein [Kribbella jiaozuonensis]TKK73385.1 hypothetical protein FDA38_39415 [Kribbella jiaozuonensis]